MANTDGPFGLRPIGCLGGGGVPETAEYGIASGYATSIFTGDPVEMTGAGGTDTGLPIIQVAAAGNPDNIGVFMGCSYTDSSGGKVFSRYWPASTTATDIRALVVDQPFTLFEAQTVSGTPFNDDMIGQLADWTLATAGSTTTGLSGAEVDISSTGTTGKSLRIMRRVPRPDVEEDTHAKVIVMIVEHALNPHADSGTIVGAGGI